jgi:hypothetical protein
MESKRKNSKKNLLLLLVDAVLLGGFWLVNQVRLTGMAFHEWFGIALGVILILHLVMHWRWVVNVVKKFFKRSGLVQHLKLVLDVVGFAAFFTIIISGILMSKVVLPSLGLTALHSHSLKMIHVTATNLTIAMIAGHLLLNVGTIFKMLKCMLPKGRKPVAREALQAE